MDCSEILIKVFELKDKIVNSDLYLELKNKEKAMLEDEECSKLLYLYQNVQSKYNEAKRFEKYGSDMASVSKELSETRCKVEEHCLVKDYNECYKRNVKQIKEIEKILFQDIVKKRKEIEIE